MRIAMVGAFGLHPKGTMRARALPLAQELARCGHAVKIVMPPWHTPAEAGRAWQLGAVSIEYVRLGPKVPLLSHLLISLRILRSALAWEPEVVHCFKPKAYAGIVAWMLWQLRRLRLVRARLVVDEDDWEGAGGWNALERYPAPMGAFFSWQERWGLRHNDALTVASRALETLAWSLGAPPARVHYVPNGASLSGVDAVVSAHWEQAAAPSGAGVGSTAGEPVRESYGLGASPVVLLYTRFFEYDVARIVEVWRRIAAAVPGARLLVVGKALFTRDDARFDWLVSAAGLSERVLRVGWVPQEQLPRYFAAADLALYPFDDNLVNRAKCSAKLTELLAAGVAVVADAVGQNGEYIIHNETGILVPSGDIEAMASAAARLLRDEPLRRSLGAAARARMAPLFSWANLACTVLRAYVDRSPSAAAPPGSSAKG